MVTAMTGIVVWSSLFINKPGIIQEPDSDYDFIIGNIFFSLCSSCLHDLFMVYCICMVLFI